jgi:hypothetical protein
MTLHPTKFSSVDAFPPNLLRAQGPVQRTSTHYQRSARAAATGAITHGRTAFPLGASRGIYARIAMPHHAPDAQPPASMRCHRWGKGPPPTLLLVGERTARGQGVHAGTTTSSWKVSNLKLCHQPPGEEGVTAAATVTQDPTWGGRRHGSATMPGGRSHRHGRAGWNTTPPWLRHSQGCAHRRGSAARGTGMLGAAASGTTATDGMAMRR